MKGPTVPWSIDTTVLYKVTVILVDWSRQACLNGLLLRSVFFFQEFHLHLALWGLPLSEGNRSAKGLQGGNSKLNHNESVE
jgi:hypothetical protein